MNRIKSFVDSKRADKLKKENKSSTLNQKTTNKKKKKITMKEKEKGKKRSVMFIETQKIDNPLFLMLIFQTTR